MKEAFLKYKGEVILLSAALVILLTSSIIYFKNNSKQDEEVLSIEAPIKQTETNNKKFVIDLSGAVEKPDVYEVTAGARLKDVLALANGLSGDTDRAFFSRNFNLARVLKDQEKIHIPSVYEVQNGLFKEPTRLIDLTTAQILPNDLSTSQNITAKKTVKININKSTLAELDSLPGIGQATAQKIISQRPYTSVEDLLNKKTVNKNVFEKIKELISVE